MSKFQIDEEAISALSKILLKEGLSEIEYRERDSCIRVVRHTHVSAHVVPHTGVSSEPIPHLTTHLEPSSNTATTLIKSTMIGTVYLASDPNAKPFVSIGDTITVGKTLLIIEAMKVMNHFKSPCEGTIVKVLVKNGDPIEFDTPLFEIAI